jgi:isoquinoline 1-oxidoreductase beta subunit
MSAAPQTSRRDFLKALGTSALLIAITPLVQGAAGQERAGATMLAGWLRIDPDGSVTVLSNTSEIGQGSGTGIAQILANELDVDWRDVRIEMAPVDAQHFNPGWGEYATYGSGGIARQFEALRRAGAQARAMLTSAAAKLWQVPLESCDTDAGQVVHRPSGRKLGYGTLSIAAAQLPVPEQVSTMPRERWRFIGKAMHRLDIPGKVNGSAQFGIDVQQPGMLVAAILQCPSFGGRLASVDPAPAKGMTGVRQVVALEDAVAVVADSYWRAKKALAVLAPVWDLSTAPQLDSDQYNAALLAAATAGGEVYVSRKSGKTKEELVAAYDAAASQAARSVSRAYTFPFLAHATMEPMNGTARVGEREAELWLPTQTQSATRDAVAKMLGLTPEAVTVHTTLAGGGFGRRIECDFALQAARIAKACGATVKLIWSREEDMRHDFYRPAAAVHLRAELDAQGLPLALRLDTACESLLDHSSLGAPMKGKFPVDPSGLTPVPDFYAIGARLLCARTIDAGVPVGYWRSVAASLNCFAYESFVDELAAEAGLSPLAYRLRLMKPGTREQRVLEALVSHAGWERNPAQSGRHRGMAIDNANGSVVAHAVELSVSASGVVKLHRITAVADCGTVVNPDSVRAQVEGGIAFALSAAFYGEITLRKGAVEQANFNDYRMITLADMPPVQVILLDSQEAPGGMGEEAVGPLMPAVANALFAATGKRVRALPFSRAGFAL